MGKKRNKPVDLLELTANPSGLQQLKREATPFVGWAWDGAQDDRGEQ